MIKRAKVTSLIPVCFVALIITCLLSPRGSAQEITEHRLNENVMVLEGAGGNITVVATEEGLVITDTFTNPAAARKARALIEKFSDKPVRYVINTHFHSDHCFGNQVFADATIIGCKDYVKRIHTRYGEDIHTEIEAQINEVEKQLQAPELNPEDKARLENLLKEIRQEREEFADFVLTPPDISLDGGAKLYIGGKTFNITHFGTAHTDTDLVIHVPEEQLLIVGDLFWDNRIPYIDPIESDPLNWMDLLEKLQEKLTEVKYVVPGHGKIRGVEALREQQQFLHDLWHAVQEARESGISLEEAKESLRLERYKDYLRYDDGLPYMIESCWRIQERTSSKQSENPHN